ncbi:hypothetical protein [Streptomyces hesseae]|uniref:Transposase n=1 Tax=Streptomyces hesseae TaxID=3075519 RepID=A0ABU2T0V4_9ACTN|nr:hypothetical protein [Streptomyces sp. DSM 40473]MDT0453920.1 hypothetical protein [Streptomyces sp. DSM 40473]
MSPRSYFPGRGTLIEETFLKGKAEGRRKERAEGVLRVLEIRGVSVSPKVRERVLACVSLDTLWLWLDRALVVSTAEEIFTDAS